MRILGCVRAERTEKSEEPISPQDKKTKAQSNKIGFDSKPGLLQRLFSRAKSEEKTRLTDNRV